MVSVLGGLLCLVGVPKEVAGWLIPRATLQENVDFQTLDSYSVC